MELGDSTRLFDGRVVYEVELQIAAWGKRGAQNSEVGYDAREVFSADAVVWEGEGRCVAVVGPGQGPAGEQ